MRNFPSITAAILLIAATVLIVPNALPQTSDSDASQPSFNSSAAGQLKRQSPQRSPSIVVCSEDIAPAGMAVTWTGDSPVCRNSCRARRLDKVRGPIMLICAHQPVPPGYTLDSVTTSPNCRCLGSEDNAYVIRKLRAEK